MLLRSIVFLLVLSAADVALGQEGTAPETRPKAIHVDDVGRASEEQLRAQFDMYFAELANNPQMQGYVIFYNGSHALPGKHETSPYELYFTDLIGFRGFDRSRITIVRGGFREYNHAEMWMLPPGAEAPKPHGTIDPPKIPEGKTLLYDARTVIQGESDEFLDAFELPEAKAARMALDAEVFPEPNEDPGVAVDEAWAKIEAEQKAADAAAIREVYEKQKFDWISNSFGHYLKARKGSTGVLIYYADDHRFDIGKLHLLIDEARQRMAKKAGIAIADIMLEYGGYRESVEAEFWFVPARGSQPAATPEERPVEDPEHSIHG